MSARKWIAVLGLAAGPAIGLAQATIPLHDLVVYRHADNKLKGHFYVMGTGFAEAPAATLQATKQATFEPGGPWSEAIPWRETGRLAVLGSTRIKFETVDAVDADLKVACFWMRGVSRGITERSLTADNIEGDATWYRERFDRAAGAMAMRRMLAPIAALRPVAPAWPASTYVDGVLPITLHRPLESIESYSVQAIWAWVTWGFVEPEVFRKNKNPNLGGGWALRVGQKFGNGFWKDEKIADVDPSDFVMFSVKGTSYEPVTGEELTLWSAVTREN